ncbi:hypothetical protein KKF91_21855 [Myxococcota bacterium]|nr:hypothetical protein [Myxococcota bacterium]MBU1433191.1 hypothetical protein [Myxococcota bacterium]MBU1900182.1 hypothetical protein [Myxococcota bacterium]
MRRALPSLLLYPTLALATLGGPDHIEVLGLEPIDGKVYILKHVGGEVADLPRLGFFALNDAQDPHARWVHTGYQGEPQIRAARFNAKLAALKARLKPLKAAPLLGAELRLEWRDHRVCADAPSQPKTAEAIRARIAAYERGEGQDPEHPVCLAQTVTVRWAGYEGVTFIETWGGARLTGLWRLDDPRFALARLRHVGKHLEVGDEVDLLFLLRRVEAPPISAPRLKPDPRCAALPYAAADDLSARRTPPGAWLPALAPRWLTLDRWRRAESRRFTLDAVDYTATLLSDDGGVLFVVARAHQGGECLIAVHQDDFGGNGVEAELVEINTQGARAALIFRHDRAYHGGEAERAWSILLLGAAEARWWVKGAAWPAARLRLSWDPKGAPRLYAQSSGQETPLKIVGGQISRR